MTVNVTEYYKIKEYPVKNPTRVVFWFPAGFTKLWQYRYTILLLNRMGISVVGFDFKWRKSFNELSPEGLIDFSDQINVSVGEIMSGYSSDMKYSVFGTSVGGVFSLHIAKNYDQVDSAILNMPYGTVSHLLWTYKPAKEFRQRFIDSGIDSEAKLHKLLKPIETQRNLGLLRDKRIVNFTAQNDKIVFDGYDFAKALKKAVPSSTLHETQFGHFWGGIENILRKSKWDSVLRD